MKIQKSKTNKILMRAYTTSDWDNCDCAIVDTSDLEKIVNKWDKFSSDMKEFEEDFSIIFSIYGVDFYEIQDESIEDILNGNDIVFIEIDEKEFDKFLKETEQIAAYPKMEISKNGIAYLRSSTKHTQDECYTVDFTIEQMKKMLS